MVLLTARYGFFQHVILRVPFSSEVAKPECKFPFYRSVTPPTLPPLRDPCLLFQGLRVYAGQREVRRVPWRWAISKTIFIFAAAILQPAKRPQLRLPLLAVQRLESTEHGQAC